MDNLRQILGGLLLAVLFLMPSLALAGDTYRDGVVKTSFAMVYSFSSTGYRRRTRQTQIQHHRRQH